MNVTCVTVAFPPAELKAMDLSEGYLPVLASVDTLEELYRVTAERVPSVILAYAPRSAAPEDLKAFAESLDPVPALLFVTENEDYNGFDCVPVAAGYAEVKARAIHAAQNNSQLVIRLKDKALDERIANIFLSAGIPPHVKGYRFLREAVKKIVAEPDLINAITKELYPAVATEFGTTPSKVERAIRHAIEVAWARGKIENINNIYGVKVFGRGEKPTNGELIALIADKLIIEYS